MASAAANRRIRTDQAARHRGYSSAALRWPKGKQRPCRKTPKSGWKKSLAAGENQGNLQAVSGLCAGRGQDLSHAERRHPAAQPRRRRGHRHRRNARPQGHRGTGRSKLETVPRKKLEYKGTIFEEMDVDAIIARHPQVVLVDELAHTNIPGSKHRKRYEDVQEILAAKIDVLSTLNIQHVESIAPDRAHHRHHRARNGARLGSADGQRDRDGGPDAGGAAEPPAPRRRLQSRQGRPGAARTFSAAET